MKVFKRTPPKFSSFLNLLRAPQNEKTRRIKDGRVMHWSKWCCMRICTVSLDNCAADNNCVHNLTKNNTFPIFPTEYLHMYEIQQRVNN